LKHLRGVRRAFRSKAVEVFLIAPHEAQAASDFVQILAYRELRLHQGVLLAECVKQRVIPSCRAAGAMLGQCIRKKGHNSLNIEDEVEAINVVQSIEERLVEQPVVDGLTTPGAKIQFCGRVHQRRNGRSHPGHVLKRSHVCAEATARENTVH
jgi:hypothetical protein